MSSFNRQIYEEIEGRMNETKWPHSVWRTCVARLPHVSRRKSQLPKRNRNTTTEEEIRLLQAEIELCTTSYILLLSHKRITLIFRAQDYRIVPQEEQASLLYLVSSKQVPLKLWLYHIFLSLLNLSNLEERNLPSIFKSSDELGYWSGFVCIFIIWRMWKNVFC